LELATGGQPEIARPQAVGVDPFAHPDAQRRFRIMADVEELARALDYPWEKWTVFLHPAQRQIMEKDFNGPARVSGSAGTGKTIVALHRAVFLARSNPDARILLTTFSESLANALRVKLARLISNEPRIGERLEVYVCHQCRRRAVFTHCISGPPRWPHGRRSARCCLKRPMRSKITDSATASCSVSGRTWSMHGSWIAGRHTAM
jgi:hypothetical protein